MILQFETKKLSPSSKASSLPDNTQGLLDLGYELRRLHYRFTTPTPATIALVNARPENAKARTLVDIFGWNREFNAALVPDAVMHAMREAGVVAETPNGLRSKVRVSSIGEHLFFHSDFPAMERDSVLFGPDTYRFVRQLRTWLPSLGGPVTRCVDIGCGAGAGALEIASMCPSASVHAVDTNPIALTYTRVNARLANASNLVTESSHLLADVPGTFDLIVANRPDRAAGEMPPSSDGGDDLGDAASLAVVDAAMARLAPGGTLLLYTACAIVEGVDHLADEAARRLERSHWIWSYDEIDPDVFGDELASPRYGTADRIAAVWLRATKPASYKVYW